MNQRTVSRTRRAHLRKRQRGVYALEWIVIFTVFFMLLYAMVGFGLGFLVRESMQWAAEDGARAALQYQSTRTERKARALQVMKANLAWLPAPLLATIDQGDNFVFQICRLNDASNCTKDMSPAGIQCDPNNQKPCMVQVQLTLPYAQHAFTPSLTLGLMESKMPDLYASSQALVDQSGF